MSIHRIYAKAAILLCLFVFSAPSFSDDNLSMPNCEYLSGIEPQREGNTWFIDESVSFSIEWLSTDSTDKTNLFLYENRTGECMADSFLASVTDFYLLYYPLPHFAGENLLLVENQFEHRSWYYLYLFGAEHCQKIGTMMLRDESDRPFIAPWISFQAGEDVISITFTQDAYLDNGYIFGEDVPKLKIDSFEYYFDTGEFRMNGEIWPGDFI